MTPEELSDILSRLGLTQAGASAVLGVSDRAIRMWLSGDRAVPAPVAKLLRLIASKRVSIKAVQNA